MWVFHSCVCKIGITKTTTSERNPSSIKQSWIRFCAWVRPWLTRKSPKSYKEPWDCWEEASCAAANQIHSAIQWSVQRDRGRDREKALFRGQLLECCYTSKPHHHCPWLQDSLTNELSVLFYFKKDFFILQYSNQNVHHPNTQASDLYQSCSAKVKLKAAAQTRTGFVQEWSLCWSLHPPPLSFMFIQSWGL